MDGLPIPSSSSFFTRLASVNLGDGSVKCCKGLAFTLSISSLIFNLGIKLAASSSSSVLLSSLSSEYTFINPWNEIFEPLALNIIDLSLLSKSTITLSISAEVI